MLTSPSQRFTKDRYLKQGNRTMNLNRREFIRLTSLSGLLLPGSVALAQQSNVDADTQFGRIRGIQYYQ
jgi:hypothetical protein|tara:strand:+ start:3726 stop:3932 length:207 start_codon:yes stop_codon:yes gene_type:complete